MMNKFREIRKKNKIKIKELSKYSEFSSAHISRLETGKRLIKRKQAFIMVTALNKALKDRNIDKIINIEDMYVTPQQELDRLVEESTKDKSIYSEQKQKEIEEFGKEKEVHSLKYRYLIAKYNKKIGNVDKSLEIFMNLLNDFNCSNFLYSILIEIIRLEQIEKTYDIFLKYKSIIDKSPLKIKGLLYYNTGVNLLRCKKYNKALNLFKEVINIPIKTKQYYKSWNNMGICLQKQQKYEEAMEAFKKRVSDPTNYNDLRNCYVNIISCAKELKNEILMKITLKKLENILTHLKNSVYYQTYYCMGLDYLYLGEKEKAIKAFEKEINFKIDYDNSSFSIEKHLKAINFLIKLYKLDTIKQQRLIINVINIPVKYLDKVFILEILKYYFENNMKYEGELLLKKLKL